MKELIKNQVTIEQVCNTFNVNVKNELLKIWPSVKKKFLERFGENNTRISVNDINEFFRTVLTEPETTKIIADFAKQGLEDLKNNRPRYVDTPTGIPVNTHIEQDGTEESKENVISFQDDDTEEVLLSPILNNKTSNYNPLHSKQINDNTYVIYKEYDKKKTQPLARLYLMVIQAADPLEENSRKAIVYSLSGYKNTFYEFPVEGSSGKFTKKELSSKLTEILSYTDLTESDILWCLGINTFHKNDMYNALVNNKKIIPIIAKKPGENNTLSINAMHPNKAGRSGKSYPHEYGYGISNETLPKLVPFGKLKINLKKLKYDDILSLKNSNGTSIGGLPNLKISDRFSKILMNLLKGIHPHRDDLTSLHSNEKQVYDRIIVMGGLHKTVANDHSETLADVKKRINLLMGEIEIGNDSPLIKTELKQLAGVALSMKGITNKEYNNFISQLDI